MIFQVKRRQNMEDAAFCLSHDHAVTPLLHVTYIRTWILGEVPETSEKTALSKIHQLEHHSLIEFFT